METLFENSYIRNKAFVKEFYRYYYFEKSSVMIAYSVILLSFLISIFLAVFCGIYNWFVFSVVPLLFLFQLYRYFYQVNIILKRDRELAEEDITVHVAATEDFIQNTTSLGAVGRLGYDKIKVVEQTKNLILLYSKEESVFIFAKNSFEKGTKEEFIAFLKAKGIRVK